MWKTGAAFKDLHSSIFARAPVSKDTCRYCRVRPAEALQKIADKKDGSKFNEAGKVVSKPEPYGTDDVEQDIAKWTEFYDGFRA